ncbi:ABC transporter ATP-binding protein [Thiohalomonas denitrificans]|uniref:ABC transporter ATP-binding protein n=1 Tax=Thiohalomonas denitrificans TaxID=415747 RepID=UPI0026E9C882|nr:ABC transporter ATP-binding protein [Thiohalomonas denitrificans]
MSAIELYAVRKAFNEGRPNEFLAVDGVDLEIEPGRITVLTGPSGSGKTTLLTLIGCLARPTEGRVHLGGESVSGLPERFLTELRRRTFGFVFQQFNLIRGLSVLENVMLPAYPLGPHYSTLHGRAMELLTHLRLGHRAEARVEWLSGGEAQRAAIARALINDPSVVIADEPTANLDSHLSAAFLDIVAELRSQGRTVLLTSHDPLITGAGVVDRVVAMRDGRVV